MRNFIWASIFVAFFLSPCAVFSFDFDLNNIPDHIEAMWANKYKPTFLLNSRRILEPEPVEILDWNGDGILGIEDTWSLFWVIEGAGGMIECEDLFCNCHQNNESCTGLREFFDHPGIISVNNLVSLSHFDYGGPGNENPEDWEDTYLYGRGNTLPGSAFEPTVYCHFVVQSPTRVDVQYWFYYPYNDAGNQHEGDWEHIVVELDEANCLTGAAEVVGVVYYAHEGYTPIGENYTYTIDGEEVSPFPLLMDESHPIVFVGGTTEGPVSVGEGNSSGASWPSFGTFNYHNIFGLFDEVVSHRGKCIHYEEVNVEIMPNFNRLDIQDEPLPGGVDLSAWFLENPDKSWMRSSLYWGHFISDSPWSWVPSYEESSQSGTTPPYHDTWTEHQGYYQAGVVSTFVDRNAVLMLTAKSQDFGYLDVESWVDMAGFIYYKIGACNLEVENSMDRNLSVMVQHTFSLDSGQMLEFAQWSDGVLDNPRTVFFPAGGQDFVHLQAEYRPISPDFSDVSSEVFPSFDAENGAWGDYDGDGDYDLFVIQGGDTGKLMRNDNGVFVEIDFPDLLQATSSASWGDVDNDGDLDLLLAPDGGNPGCFRIRFNDNGFENVLETGSGFYFPLPSPAWVDLTNDGYLDVFLLGSSDDPKAGYGENSGPEWFSVPITNSTYVPTNEGGAWGDYNGDQLLDFCSFGPTASGGGIYLNQGRDLFDGPPFEPAPLVFDPPTPFGYLSTVDCAAWIDFDNDGDLDLSINNIVWEHIAEGQFSQAFELPFVSQGRGNWADFDNDGWVDVLIGSRLFLNTINRNTGSPFTEVTGFSWPENLSGEWIWVDYDGDGDLDLFSFGNPVQLYKNNLSGEKKSFRLKLIGHKSNATGIGATVIVNGANIPICRNSGIPNPISPILVGIGDENVAIPIEVVWPSGFCQSAQWTPGQSEVEIEEPSVFDVKSKYVTDLRSGKIDLCFSWKTDFECMWEEDCVVFGDELGTWINCEAPYVTLNSNNSVHSYQELQDGVWQHNIVLEDIPCEGPDCLFVFSVFSTPASQFGFSFGQMGALEVDACIDVDIPSIQSP